MRAKTFFYACAGIFLLALSYHLGARNAGAQAPGNPVVSLGIGGGDSGVAITSSGDVYYTSGLGYSAWTLRGNVFSGATPAKQETWGQLKARYR